MEILRRGPDRLDLLPIVQKLQRRLWMSTVVAMELRAGATTRAATKAVSSLVEPFRFRDRLVVPEAAEWLTAGSVLARLSDRAGLEAHARGRLVCDTLIAVSARRVGATVVTLDEMDFGRIRQVFDFGLETLSGLR